MANKKKTIGDGLNQLEKIVNWFETREEIDVEAGLDKVAEGAALIKELKNKLKKVENDFKEIKEGLDRS